MAETIPFEKLLSIGQYKLGIHTCLVGSDLIGNDASLKIGLFGQTISLKSALSDFKPGKWCTLNVVVIYRVQRLSRKFRPQTSASFCLLFSIIRFDIGIAGGSYSNRAICQKCTKPILFIERIIVAERAFHRSCMHCYLCGKRLFLGMFRIVGDHLECFEHLLNKSISGNELLSFENAKAIKSPPPRPPPPRKSVPAGAEEPKTSPVVEEKPAEKVEEKPVTPPEIKKPASPTPTKTAGNGGSDHSESGNNWDIIEYPEQLNPFSDDEIDKLVSANHWN